MQFRNRQHEVPRVRKLSSGTYVAIASLVWKIFPSECLRREKTPAETDAMCGAHTVALRCTPKTIISWELLRDEEAIAFFQRIFRGAIAVCLRPGHPVSLQLVPRQQVTFHYSVEQLTLLFLQVN